MVQQEDSQMKAKFQYVMTLTVGVFRAIKQRQGSLETSGEKNDEAMLRVPCSRPHHTECVHAKP